MKRGRFSFICLSILAFALAGSSVGRGESKPASSGDDDAAAKQRDIRRLLDLTGSGKLGVRVAGQMIDQFRTLHPNVPGEFWDEFKKEIKPDELNELVVPIYEKHFNHDDILELIRFYQSPVGQKLTTALPQITQEAMTAGQQWGQNLARKCQQRLKEKGYVQT